MRAIERLFPKADEAIKKNLLESDKNGVQTDKVLAKVYKGYVAGFGVSVVNSGVLPALAIYVSENKANNNQPKNNREGNMLLVADALAQILGKANGMDLFATARSIQGNYMKTCQLKEDVINASIALKIMLSTYYIPEQ